MKAVSPHIDFAQMERELLAEWQKDQTFKRSNELRNQANEFLFYDGPPFANGLPHYGHLLASTLKDTVPRYWNMRGFFVERRFGWDCHGLPVEYDVQNKKGLSGRTQILEFGVDKFNEACRASVQHYTAEWQRTITRLGRWVDWENQYRTMDRDFMESVWWVFSQLHKKGLVYRDLKIVAYSPKITAVVSNFEANLNYKQVQDPSIIVKFKLTDEQAYLLAWTTTPWTLISNLALVIGPKIRYVKIKDHATDEIYYLAEKRLEEVYKKNPSGYEVLETICAESLKSRSYEPLFPYFKTQENAFKVVVDDFVSLETGTGIVHAAPAYGEDDFRVCRKNEIGIVDPLDEEARFIAPVNEYEGQYIKDADKQIIRDLKQQHKLFSHETIVHSYPHCDRTEDPLIYRAIPTWYVAVEKIKHRLVEHNRSINWVPEHLRDGRMGKWLENARDWAISRNRFWGTPLPIWVNENDETDFEVVGSVAELEEKTGTTVTDLHKHYVDQLSYKSKTGATMKRVPEVFDCWFESGSMPYSQKHYPFENEQRFETTFPADFIAEGLDQTRGWFYTLLVLSTALFDKPAFKNVVVNGTVLAEDGKKMSKRLGNYTPPETLLDKYGADSVRLYMLNSAVIKGGDMKFSDSGVKDTTRAVLLPLWNAFSFLTTYAQADQWQPDLTLASRPPHSNNELDRWILSRLQTLKQSVHVNMEKYLLYLVVPRVLDFIEDLTNWYIRLSRRRFWNSEAAQLKDKQHAYETLYFVLCEFTKILAPFAPFVSDRIYKDLTKDLDQVFESVHLCESPQVDDQLIDRDLESRMELVRRATNLGRSLRAKHQIKTRQVLPSMMVITYQEDDRRHIEQGKEILKDELNVKEINFSTDEAQFVRLSVKPNLKVLGKRLGKKVNDVRIALQKLNETPEQVTQLLQKLNAKREVNVAGVTLAHQDLLIERGPKDERLIATEEGVTVLLDTRLDESLILEGLSREVVNRIQKLRKDSHLNVSDRIRLGIAASGKLADAINIHKDYIAQETLATELETDAAAVKAAEFKERFKIEGSDCDIGFSVVS